MLQYCQSGGTVIIVVGILILSTMPPQILDLDEFIEKHHAVRWGISLALGGLNGLWVRTGCGKRGVGEGGEVGDVEAGAFSPCLVTY